MVEEWKAVVGFEGLYEVSSFGRIKSLKRRGNWKEHIMKTCVHKNGYERVELNKDGKPYYCLVHRLVATSFIPNPENKPEVNHKNGDKTDNKVDNLEWATKSENIKHAYNNRLVSEDVIENRIKKMNNAHRKQVMRSDGIIFDSVKSAAESIGVSTGYVSNAAHGRCNSVRGYKFTFI